MNNQCWYFAMRMLRKSGLLLAVLVSSVGAFAQTAIESVTGSVQGGTEVIRIELTQPITALPTGFTIQSPARIALDFPGITNGMGRSAVEVNQGNLRSVSVVQAGDRTRVVLNLKQSATYKADIRLLFINAPSAPHHDEKLSTTFRRRVPCAPLPAIKVFICVP